MRFFLINLDKDVARLEAADAQLRKLRITYTRIPAVYGKELSQEERDAAVNKFRWWCAMGRSVGIGEIGCALSHYQIYQRMIDENIPYACILEDDVILKSEFSKQLQVIEQWLDTSKSQVVLLSNHTSEFCNDWQISPAKKDMYAEAYILTQQAAKALLKANLPMQTPCDHWGRWVKTKAIELYHAFPTVCTQDQTQFVSGTVDNTRFNVAKLPLPLFILHKAKRLIGKILDNIL